MAMGSEFKASGWNTSRSTALIIIIALVLLMLIARGFRGVSVGGVSVGIQ